MAEYLLEMRNTKKSFYGIQVLNDVSFGVRPGEVHVLLGENGAGKSTLMKILSGVYKADGGDVLINGEPVEIKNPAHSIDLGIGMVYQELSVVPELTVVENIWLGNLPRKAGFIKWSEAKAKTQQIFDNLGVDININKRASTYDLGIQQLIEIFRVVFRDVKLVILDEPTSSLTDVETEKLFETIRKLKKEGVSFVYITHKLEEVFEIGDRITVLRDGSTIGETIESVADIQEDKIITMMVGRPIEEQHPKEHNMKDDVVLDVQDLTNNKNFFDISFQLHAGEILGVAGLVGSGRSALAKALFGLEKVREGDITLHHEKYTSESPAKAIKNHMGLITKDRKDGLLLHMPISVNVSISKKDGIVKGGFRQIKNEIKEANKYIDILSIAANSPTRRVRDLSGGNQQKVAVARWLCNDTEIFLMDEPTRGVDVGSRVEIYNLMNEITRNGGAILMISSDMPELLGMADNIIVMRHGRITAKMNAQECTQERIFEKAAGSEVK